MKRKQSRSIAQIKNKSRVLIRESIHEAALSVLPVIFIVLIFSLFLIPVSPDLLVSFLIGSVFVIIGMGLFSLGAERSMTPIGSEIGTALTKTASLPLILITSFVMGFAVTASEPDLQVLSSNVPHIDSRVLIYSVSAGVGFFMMLCMLRIIKGWKLRTVLLISYIPILIMAFFAEADFLPVAFDSGGVTTGPMTVPFILALGMGVSNIRSDADAEADSFGLVGLSSAGPILVVLLLGFFYKGSGAETEEVIRSYTTAAEISKDYLAGIPVYLKEMAAAILPAAVLTVIFQIAMIHMSKKSMMRIIVGLMYTYIGLVLFMTGVNVGFSAMGRVLGAGIAAVGYPWLLIPAAMLLGGSVISAEPAVAVLTRQIEEVSAGAIPRSAIEKALKTAVMLAMGLSALRVLTGISLLWFIIPGYILAFVLSFHVPAIYMAIAFDSGGTASGPMTASFLLPFIIGACSQLGGSVLKDAFGVVSLVALLPIISVEVTGVIFSHKNVSQAEETYSDYEIVDLF